MNKTKEQKTKEKEKMEKWGLKGSKKIIWDRITELESKVEELQNETNT